MQMDLFDRFLTKILGNKTSGNPTHSADKSGREKTGKNNDDLSKTIILDGQPIVYTLRRSSRRSIGFLVNETGLRVTAPRRSSLFSIEKAIEEKQKWILSKLDFYRYNRPVQTAPIHWDHGALVPYLGKKLPLETIVGTGKTPVFKIENDALLVYQSDNSKPLGLTLKNWLVQQARDILSNRLSLQAKRMNIPFSSFSVSNARTRWGSCSIKRHIRLNWRLVHCDVALIDYVVIHELAHCLEMNHSRRFWNIVETYYPDYKNARKQLHLQSSSLFSLFDQEKSNDSE